ncbi:tetratricopeptide repeat protein [Flaviaesturariibacter amylovorans]|uniref:Tetratricopeptide repeat protein n=1 Tax=Flaviaesturariibacter amylovorans TaxID=1084520 RepID=A0ABP8G9P7_9BACT
MRKLSCVSALLFICLFVQAQRDVMLDSFQRQLSVAKTPSERVTLLGRLMRYAASSNPAESDRWGRQLTEEAERSRDRVLIFKSLMYHGERYTYQQQNRDALAKSIDFFTRALDVARRNKLDKEQAGALLALGSTHLALYEYDKAHRHISEAFSLANILANDSLLIVSGNAMGNYYLVRNERLLSLRSYLNSLRLAEGRGEPALLRNCYVNLGRFYESIEEYDRAIDYVQKSMVQLALMKQGGEAYNRAQDIYKLGALYTSKKDADMAVSYFEHCVRLADTLKSAPLKVMGYTGLLNQYLRGDQPQKAYDYFKSRPEIRQYFERMGMPETIDQVYAVIYKGLGRYDSSEYFFNRSLARYEQNGSPFMRMAMWSAYADLHKKTGNNAAAIAYLEKTRTMAQSSGNIDWQQLVVKELDTLYARSGDFRKSYEAQQQYYQFKDSLKKLGEEKDLLQVELADEQQRQARLDKEKAAALERKHTLQYMGITVAIGAVFVLLVLLGFLQVSAGVIKVLGFFSFIFLFEFLILIADNKIHHATHGEPLKVLAIKIVLIAALLPLHHWLEHKVVHYIASRKLKEDASRVGFARFLRRKAVKPSGEQ